MSHGVSELSRKHPPSVGQCAQVACVWEATARKAGNVHRFADFADLTYIDFVLSALAIAPVMERAANEPIGTTILDAVHATREVVDTNANLGIVLLLAPLAKSIGRDGDDLRLAVARSLSETTVEDARLTYEAIRLAKPGGMGQSPEQDIAGEPTGTLREVMALAAERDRIARQYVCDFVDVFEVGVPALQEGWHRHGCVEGAIVHTQLELLAKFPDSLIARKLGIPEAEQASAMAQDVLESGGIGTDAGRSRFADFDNHLRADGHQRNPGTTADLVTASLFVALRQRTIEVSAPFPFEALR